jgi:23S rRNA (guanosine2251-2'-O)-methyltransferase
MKTYWIYGRHAVVAALNNPERKVFEICATDSAYKFLKECNVQRNVTELKVRIVKPQDIDALLKSRDAVHQGIAIKVEELENKSLNEVLFQKAGASKSRIILLDQITDPHNVGAIIRSSAAFSVDAVLTTFNNSAEESGVMVKSSAGMIEFIPLVYVSNLANAIRELKEEGYWIVGMDGNASSSLSEAAKLDKVALVMGSEGEGMRRLTRELCDLLVKIPMSNKVESLNVSNAAAIAMYELAK